MAPTKALAAFVIYSAILACAVWSIAIHLDRSGGQAIIDATCPPGITAEYTKRYAAGIQGLGSMLCGLNSFFKSSLEDPVKDLTIIFLMNGPIASLVMLLESGREDRPYVASLPLLAGLLTQTITGGLAATLYWLFFLVQVFLSGTRRAEKPVSRTEAEAALLGVLVGYMIPTAWMIMNKDTPSIMFWQPFPVYSSLVQNAWLWLKRNEKRTPGVDLVQLSLLLLSGMGSITWIYLILPHLSKFVLIDLWRWLPSWSVPDPLTNTLTATVLHALQYDAIWMFAATILAGVFLMEDKNDVFYVIQTLPGLVAIFGPAAMIGGLWVFREMQLTIRDQAKEAKVKSD
ncbi:hypothetical protein CPB86DRAFT_412040 [Serendipita vermifera]|nr:hypothetical protein CPB86DRAFT_412040 [Serendipita vermifera]